MALSNWDTLMVNKKGKPLTGFWLSDSGIGVEVYKNWLYIHDKKAYVDGKACYAKPIIAKVDEGMFDYKDLKFCVFRGPQNGVYAVVWKDYYSKGYKKHWIKGCIGIGVYGFVGDNFVGVKPSSIDWFMKKISDDKFDLPIDILKGIKLKKAQRLRQRLRQRLWQRQRLQQRQQLRLRLLERLFE